MLLVFSIETCRHLMLVLWCQSLREQAIKQLPSFFFSNFFGRGKGAVLRGKNEEGGEMNEWLVGKGCSVIHGHFFFSLSPPSQLLFFFFFPPLPSPSPSPISPSDPRVRWRRRRRGWRKLRENGWDAWRRCRRLIQGPNLAIVKKKEST